MRRATLTVVALALLLSLGVGVLLGRMAGGGSGRGPDDGLTAPTAVVDTPAPAGSPVVDAGATRHAADGSPPPPSAATNRG